MREGAEKTSTRCIMFFPGRGRRQFACFGRQYWELGCFYEMHNRTGDSKKNSEPVQTFCISKETQVRRLMVDVLDIDNEK